MPGPIRRPFAAFIVVMAGLVPSAFAGKTEIDRAVAFFGDLYAVAALCPSLQVNNFALARGPMIEGFTRDQWQLIIDEGRRRSPEFIRELSAAPESVICDYGRTAFGVGDRGYLLER